MKNKNIVKKILNLGLFNNKFKQVQIGAFKKRSEDVRKDLFALIINFIFSTPGYPTLQQSLIF